MLARCMALPCKNYHTLGQVSLNIQCLEKTPTYFLTLLLILAVSKLSRWPLFQPKMLKICREWNNLTYRKSEAVIASFGNCQLQMTLIIVQRILINSLSASFHVGHGCVLITASIINYLIVASWDIKCQRCKASLCIIY